MSDVLAFTAQTGSLIGTLLCYDKQNVQIK